MLRKLGLTLLLASAVSGTCFGLNNPPFPRIAANDIGSPQNYEDPTVQAQLARFNFALISIWPGWSGGHGGVSIQQVVQNITALNPDSLVFMYTDVNELGDAGNSASDIWSVERNKLNSMGWWLYSNGGGGTRVKSTWGTNFYTINTTSFVPVDSNGYHFTDWMAHYLVSTSTRRILLWREFIPITYRINPLSMVIGIAMEPPIPKTTPRLRPGIDSAT